MKKLIVSTLLAAITLLWSGVALSEIPLNLGGFKLGEDIGNYEEQVNMNSCLAVRYMEYMQEAEISPTAGFKSGLIAFGTCDQPNRILRIKLKYADSSKGFYNQLLKKYKEKFGDPNEWRGDPFHIVIAWKWSFTDTQGRRISLILQHNTRDADEKIGNAVKMTLTSQMDKELACYAEKYPEEGKARKRGKGSKSQATDWNLFVPY